jgi:hypothetical protein
MSRKKVPMKKIDTIVDSAFPDLSSNALETLEVIERTMGIYHHAFTMGGEVGVLYCKFMLASAIKRIDDYLLGKEEISEEDRMKFFEILGSYVH